MYKEGNRLEFDRDLNIVELGEGTIKNAHVVNSINLNVLKNEGSSKPRINCPKRVYAATVRIVSVGVAT